MARRYIDFDASLAEAEDRPVVVRYLGQDWTLYSALPAKPVLRLLRLQAEGREDDELSQAELVDCLAEMVPADVMDAWLDGGMSVDEMGDLLRLVVDAYGADDEDEPGEASGPKTGPMTGSSATGGRSKRTTGANTKSTSRKR